MSTLFMPPPITEASVQADIRLALGRLPNVRMFRNQVGEGWMGKEVTRTSESVTLLHPRRVPFGLVRGSGDLIGWTTVIVTPEMVGQRLAVFTSGEVKRPTIKRLAEDQQNWCNAVRAAGGFADMLRSVDDALKLVRAR